jgi:Sap, sulfolipid-1-addressing protein
VISAGAHVLFYAIIAAASPLVLTATFVVIRSERPRTNGIAFLTGFLFGTAVACIVGLFVGETVVAHVDSHETVENGLTFLLGAALLAVGLQQRHAPPRAAVEGGSRGRAILAGLGRVRPAAALSMAGLLGFGGPKRLVLTLLAMAAITAASLGHAEDLTLVVLYIAVATVLVSVPVGIVIVAGERAAVILERGQSWLTTHAAQLRVWLALGLGAALMADALVRQFA